MWFKRRPINDDFPEDFGVQRIGVAAANDLADLLPVDLAGYFREHPEVATDLLNESYDKRYTPSTYITEEGSGFSVGWLSRSPIEKKCIRRFSNLADAATDYFLFSRGKGRWNNPQISN
jgi:hypothetical protein